MYATDAVSQIAAEEGLNMEAFGRTLAHAVGWLTPIDGSIGFHVGIPLRSAMYKRLINANMA